VKPPVLVLVLVLVAGLVSAAPSARAHANERTEEARVAEILQGALVAHGPDVNRCFEKALADTLDVAGHIELAVDVGEDGRVTKAAPAVDEVKSPILLACLQQSAETWTLAGIDSGSTVIVPLAFEGQAAQWTIKVADAPDRGPAASGKGKKPKPGGPPAPAPPFSVKLLVDEATMRARQASLSQLTVSPANRIAMHKHPGSEILYVLKGHARVLGGLGSEPEKLEEGMAIFIPPGAPHVIENMGRQAPVVLLDVFAPMGPERVYRDPFDPAGRAAFEVVRDRGNPAGATGGKPAPQPFPVASVAKAPALGVTGGKIVVKQLLAPSNTGNNSASLAVVEASPGDQLARHTHAGMAEILYVVAGAGELTVGSEKIPFAADQAIHIPENQPHALKFSGPEKTVMVQIFAPAAKGSGK
jgi:quercetin dioxygenase-like cupin family protein